MPALALENGEVLLQSLAIMEYLDEVYPDPPLLPKEPIERARVRAVADIIACDIHPLNNLAPLNYLRNAIKADQGAVRAWYAHWIATGFEAIEELIKPGPYAFGRDVTIADICIVPRLPTRFVSGSRSSVFRKLWPSMRPPPKFPPSTLPAGTSA